MDLCEEKQDRTPEMRWNLRHQSQGTRNHFDGSCQGITPSNSKGGLPAPEAGVHAQEEGVRAKINLTPSWSVSGHDIFEFLFRPILRSLLEHLFLHFTNVSLMTLTTSQLMNENGFIVEDANCV